MQIIIVYPHYMPFFHLYSTLLQGLLLGSTLVALLPLLDHMRSVGLFGINQV